MLKIEHRNMPFCLTISHQNSTHDENTHMDENFFPIIFALVPASDIPQDLSCFETKCCFPGTSSCSPYIGGREHNKKFSNVAQFVDDVIIIFRSNCNPNKFIYMPPLFKNKARQPEFIVGIQFPHLEFTRIKNIYELGVLAQLSDLQKMTTGSGKAKI